MPRTKKVTLECVGQVVDRKCKTSTVKFNFFRETVSLVVAPAVMGRRGRSLTSTEANRRPGDLYSGRDRRIVCTMRPHERRTSTWR